MSANTLASALLWVLLIALPLPAVAGSWPHELGTITLDAPPKRVVALNWAATEALLLLGITPVGIADKAGYSFWVGEPELPESVANIGTRVAPSLEAIAELEPDLIVTSTELAPAAGLLERIAPTYAISVYKQGSSPFDKAREMLLTLADMVQRPERARAVLREIDNTLEHQRLRLAQQGANRKPVALMSFLDDRHMRIYTPNGLYQTALDGLGLVNAWQQPGNYWGFSVVGLEALAAYPDSRIIVIEPTPPGLPEHLASSPFWTYLAQVQNRQVYQIDTVWPFGGVLSVQRLATQLADVLIQGGSNNVH